MQLRVALLWDFMNRPTIAPGSEHWTRWAIERRSLLRILHNVPMQIRIPLDWQP